MMIQTQMASGAPWPRTKFPPSEASYQAHVLAVDDSLVDRKVIETLFRISSCKVTAVDSGRRALQFLGLDDEDRSSGPGPGVDFASRGLKVDMIITDYCMPGMSGFELLKKIKESSAFREVPVVIMSSDNINTRIDRCLEEGAEDYIVKPVKLSDVRRIKGYMMMRDDGSNASDRGRDLSDASDLSSTWTPSMQSSASSYPSSLIPSSSMPPDSNPPSSPSVSSEPSLSNSSLPAPTQS